MNITICNVMEPLTKTNTVLAVKHLKTQEHKINIFSIYVFLRRSRKKSKYRWFKVVGFGGGGLVGSKIKKKCNVSGVRCHKGICL